MFYANNSYRSLLLFLYDFILYSEAKSSIRLLDTNESNSITNLFLPKSYYTLFFSIYYYYYYCIFIVNILSMQSNIIPDSIPTTATYSPPFSCYHCTSSSSFSYIPSAYLNLYPIINASLSFICKVLKETFYYSINAKGPLPNISPYLHLFPSTLSSTLLLDNFLEK